MILTVPQDEALYPTLGPGVCAFIEERLVFGPGDLRGQPAVIDDEKRALIYRMYELFDQAHPKAGRRRFKRVGISLRKGTAKALALDTPVPTPDGWTTMGEIQAGDVVLGRDGRPCTVLVAAPVQVGHECFRVVFNDGTSIVADADHQWYTQVYTDVGDDGAVRTTREIRDTLYWHRTKPYSRHRIPVAAPLDLPAKVLPIDPYIFGAWLGDGRSDDAEFTVSATDWPSLQEQIAAAGYFTTTPKPDTRRPETLAIRISVSPIGAANNNGRPTLKGALRALGVLDNKHIPFAYLRGSVEQRLSLLQGLMDTDGTASKRDLNCTFTTTRLVLARQVVELCRTLGLRPSMRTGRAMLYGKDCGESYKVRFKPRDDVPVFRLARKAVIAQRKARKTSQALSRTIRAVEPVATVPVRCIAVDAADHLFLAGESMVPTHNTELAAWIAACELHPEAPVRCIGWKRGKPIGGPVTDPFVALVAYTEEQSDELCYGALKVILEESAIGKDFDIGLERIMRKDGAGKAVSLSGSPNARDGARTTFQVFDESHRMTLPRLKQAHQTMMANLPKRKGADSWALEITTAPEPGAGSVAEATMEYAQQIADGKIADAALFFFHRQAGDEHDLTTKAGARAAVLEASGPAAAWSDIDAIMQMWSDPTTDRTYWERVFCNRLVKSASQAFDAVRWKALAAATSPVKPGDLITLGFDGAMFHDSTALIGTHVETGYQWCAGLWECPPGGEDWPTPWKVPAEDVDAVMRALFERYAVWRLYADPPYWQSWIAGWRGSFGEERVIEWWTNRRRPMSTALEGFDSAIRQGLLSHDGSADVARHIGNARRQELVERDEQGKKLWLIRKERPDSPHKIDAAVASALSWEARTDAVAAGASKRAAYQLLILGR